MEDFELYGYSLFETFLAKKGQFWRLEQHYQRLHSSAMRLRLAVPTWQQFLQEIHSAHDEQAVELMRYTLRKSGGRWASQASPHVQILKKPYVLDPVTPVALMLHDEAFPLFDNMRQLKSGSRLAYQLAWELGQAKQFDDVLCWDQEGFLLETTIANIFLKIDHQWITPPLHRGLLPGIARQWLLEQNLAIEADIHKDQIDGAQAAILTNAVKGVVPIHVINQKVFDTNDKILHLMRQYKKHAMDRTLATN